MVVRIEGLDTGSISIYDDDTLLITVSIGNNNLEITAGAYTIHRFDTITSYKVVVQNSDIIAQNPILPNGVRRDNVAFSLMERDITTNAANYSDPYGDFRSYKLAGSLHGDNTVMFPITIYVQWARGPSDGRFKIPSNFFGISVNASDEHSFAIVRGHAQEFLNKHHDSAELGPFDFISGLEQLKKGYNFYMQDTSNTQSANINIDLPPNEGDIVEDNMIFQPLDDNGNPSGEPEIFEVKYRDDGTLDINPDTPFSGIYDVTRKILFGNGVTYKVGQTIWDSEGQTITVLERDPKDVEEVKIQSNGPPGVYDNLSNECPALSEGRCS